MLLPTVSSFHSTRLLVGERLKRDVLYQSAQHTLAALRIQGMFRVYKARKRVARLRTLLHCSTLLGSAGADASAAPPCV